MIARPVVPEMAKDRPVEPEMKALLRRLGFVIWGGA